MTSESTVQTWLIRWCLLKLNLSYITILQNIGGYCANEFEVDLLMMTSNDSLCFVFELSPYSNTSLKHYTIWLTWVSNVIKVQGCGKWWGRGGAPPCSLTGGARGGGGCPSTMKKRRHKHTYKLRLMQNENENDKFVILMQQNLGKSHFCKQMGCLHVPCHIFSGVLLTMLGFLQSKLAN